MTTAMMIAALQERRATLAAALEEAEAHRNCIRGGLAEIDLAISNFQAQVAAEEAKAAAEIPEAPQP